MGLAAMAVLIASLALATRAHAAESAAAPGAQSDTNLSRVIIVYDPDATEAFRPRLRYIRPMVDKALCALTSKASVAEAWRGLVSPRDTVGLKVYAAPGGNSGTRPAVVEAMVQGLLASGLPARQIIVWDSQTVDLRLAGFYELADRYGIRVEGGAQAGYDEHAYYESSIIGNLVWGDKEFGKGGERAGRKSYVSKLVSKEITKIINVSPMLNHNLAGVAGNLYSLATGSVDNISRFESDADRLATAVPEIYALAELSDKVVLSVTDALICQFEGSERSLLHYSSVLNELRFSFDPVALDVLSIRELARQRKNTETLPAKPWLELYANATLLELGSNETRMIKITRLR